MVETQLVESKIEDAEALLRELDRENFCVEAMFWMNRPETQIQNIKQPFRMALRRGRTDCDLSWLS